MSEDFQFRDNMEGNRPTSGSTIETVTTSREMKLFSIYESELETISTYNTEASKHWSLMWSFVSLSAACIWDIVSLAKQNNSFKFSDVTDGQLIFLCLTLLIGIYCLVQAVSYGKKRKSKFEEIRSSSTINRSQNPST